MFPETFAETHVCIRVLHYVQHNSGGKGGSVWQRYSQTEDLDLCSLGPAMALTDGLLFPSLALLNCVMRNWVKMTSKFPFKFILKNGRMLC